MKEKKTTAWENSTYGDLVGEKGHFYHQSIILPQLLKIFKLKKITSLLDVGCGNGVLARHLPKNVHYIGIDNSKQLILSAQKSSPDRKFYLADGTQKLPIEKKDFDAASFVLSLQNMENGSDAIFQVSQHLKTQGALILILNHPCFRIPRQSEWGYDETRKIQYRRLNLYMSDLKIPILMNPGKKNSTTTYSFHHPLHTIFKWLSDNHFLIETVDEWCSDKKSEGAKAKAEDRARKEFPLFLSISARLQNTKNSDQKNLKIDRT